MCPNPAQYPSPEQPLRIVSSREVCSEAIVCILLRCFLVAEASSRVGPASCFSPALPGGQRVWVFLVLFIGHVVVHFMDEPQFLKTLVRLLFL